MRHRFRFRHRESRSDGFSLVEMAVVLALTLVAVVTASRAFLAIEDLESRASDRLELVQMARAAAERSIAELRAANEFTVADDQQVEVMADLASGETRVRFYFHDPSSDSRPPFYLYRAVDYSAAGDGQALAVLAESGWSGGIPPAPVTPRVEFRYYDDEGAELITPVSGGDLSTIHRVGVTLTLENTEDGEGAPRPHVETMLRWSVTPRQLR